MTPKPQVNTLDTVKQGYICLYCTDDPATIKCNHDYIKDTTDHVLLCENCHKQAWGGETCELKTAKDKPQVNKTIDEITMWVELAVHRFNAADGLVIMHNCVGESVAEIAKMITDVEVESYKAGFIAGSIDQVNSKLGEMK